MKRLREECWCRPTNAKVAEIFNLPPPTCYYYQKLAAEVQVEVNPERQCCEVFEVCGYSCGSVGNVAVLLTDLCDRTIIQQDGR